MTHPAPHLGPLSSLDGAFISLETAATPMHVGSLNLFTLPADYAGDWLADVKAWLATRLPPVLRRRLVMLPLQLAHPMWQLGEVDLDDQVQRAQVSAPGGLAQLEDLVAQLHTQLLDRRRPLWQVTVIDGLASGERALYFKIHHAMLDGQAAAALAASLFATAPSDWPTAQVARAVPAQADAAHPPHPDARRLFKAAVAHDASQLTQLAHGLPQAWNTLRDLARRTTAGDLDPRAGLRTPGQSGAAVAPRTQLNGPITPERGFATLSLPLAEVKAIARACQVSANDVVLTACGGALSRYLARLGPLPEASLIALMALSLRPRGNTSLHNLATLSLVSLATHLTHPLQRLQAVHAHTRATKRLAQQAQALMPTDFPSLGQPWLVGALGQLVARAGALKRLPPLANVLISNVTGPAKALYLGPARMTAYWPISIVEHGVGVNLTLVRYAGQLFVGLTVARAAVPEVRLLADDLMQAYSALKMAALSPPTTPAMPDDLPPPPAMTPYPHPLTAQRITGRTGGAWPIEFEALGSPAHPAIVLIMGLGMQLVAWPDAFCQMLVDGGYRVIRFDNRDCGLSARAPAGPRFGLFKAVAASVLKLPVPSPYTLHDMAGDTLAVMDALHIRQAHMVGVSMGGMIGQVLAAEHPQRVLSLVSIMSTSGHPRLAQPKLPIRQLIMSKPARPHDLESVIDHQVRVVSALGSPRYKEAPQDLRERVGRGIRRAYDPAGIGRQVMAVIASGDRRPLLRKIKAPTLVIHGRDDPLVPLPGGEDTAAHISGAKLQVVDGMGHDLSPALLPQLAADILRHCDAVQPARPVPNVSPQLV